MSYPHPIRPYRWPRSAPLMTGSRDRLLQEIDRYQSEHQLFPTVRELGQATGFSSPSTVLDHLDRLEIFGYLERTNAAVRNRRLTKRGRAYLALWRPGVEAPLKEAC